MRYFLFSSHTSCTTDSLHSCIVQLLEVFVAARFKLLFVIAHAKTYPRGPGHGIKDLFLNKTVSIVVLAVLGLRFDVNGKYILQVHRFKVECANWLSLHFNLHLHSVVPWWHYICPYSKLSILRLFHEDLAVSFRSCQISPLRCNFNCRQINLRFSTCQQVRKHWQLTLHINKTQLS